jgi:hypothetical protein
VPETPPAAEKAETVLPQAVGETPSPSPTEPALAAAVAPTQAETLPAAETSTAHEITTQEAAAQETTGQETALPNAAQDNQAEDDAVLDMIAMEMGAPDPISEDEILEAAAEQARLAQPTASTPAIVAEAPEPVAMPAPPPVQQAVQPPPPPTAAPVPVPEVSLGSTIIASGMLRKPVTPANDPLAPIRRMSQAEKLAFFS